MICTIYFSLAPDAYRHSIAHSNQPLPKPHYDGDVMPLQHLYESKPRYQIVLKGSEDDFTPDDPNSPSIPFDEEREEEMRIVGNLAIVCSQDSDSDDTDAFLTPLNSSLNHLILDSLLPEPNQYICINETKTEVEEGPVLTTAAEYIDKIIMPVTFDKAKGLEISPKTSVLMYSIGLYKISHFIFKF